MSTNTETIAVESTGDVVDAVKSCKRVIPVGAHTKPSLLTQSDEATRLDMRQLAGILEYEPAEYTFTAKAATTLAEVNEALSEHGQYLPFDPPLAAQGATLGGTIAAGLSGSGRYRFGGIRDFLIGIRMVDGLGRETMGGGKVVKNAAGFDLPKLMVGSLGQLGILTEVTFKVFPGPKAYSTLIIDSPDISDSVETVQQLSVVPYDIEALDINVTGSAFHTRVRLGGLPDALPTRVERIQTLVGGVVDNADQEAMYWNDHAELNWCPADHALVKVPLTPNKIPRLDSALSDVGANRRYCVAGNLAWISLAGKVAVLESILAEQGLSGLVLRSGVGSQPKQIIGSYTPSIFAQRIKSALDPAGKLPPLSI